MRISLIILFFLIHFVSFGQEEGEWLQEIIENYVNQNADGNYDLDQIERQLRELIHDPVVLDSKRLDDLQRLFFLSPIVLKNIEEHLKKSPILSLYELQSIPGIHFTLARNLSRLVKLPNHEFEMQTKKFSMSLATGLNQNLLESKGYQTQKYLGSSHRSYFRSDFRIGRKIRIGLLYDKDPGESYWNRKYLIGLPHLSAFIELKGKKHIQNIILGDYKVLLGQGLLIYQGYGFGKTIDQIGNVRAQSGIRPNTSLSENFFLRGGAVHLKFKNLHLLSFASYKFRSATIYEDSLEFFKSLDLSGSLKTENDISKQSKLRESLFGTSLQWRKRKFEIGFNYLFTHFNYPYQNNFKVYQVHILTIQYMNQLSLDYKYFFRNGMLYGENAWNLESKGFALSNGVLFSLSEFTSVLANVRYFSKSYLSFYSSAISENSDSRNEIGFLLNLSHHFNRKLGLDLYFDYFHFPWLKFNVDAPSSGFEVSSRLKYRWNRKMDFYVNYRIKSKEENSYSFNSTNTLMRVWKQQLRVHFNKTLNPKFKISLRLEGNLVKIENWSTGFLFYFNLQYQPNTKWVFNYRFNLFSSETFDNAIYSLERSLGTINSFQVYSGEGLGSYLFVKFKPFRSFQINFKCSFQHYFNQLTIGSGDEEINGSFRGRVGVEMKYVLK